VCEISCTEKENLIIYGIWVNVLGKRAGQASEPVKILHILPSTTDYTSKVEDIETKQIVL
jgi:hypothetical protein